jgi:hypothetical protein
MHLIIFTTDSPVNSKQYIFLSSVLNTYFMHFPFRLAFYKSGLSYAFQLKGSKLLQRLVSILQFGQRSLELLAETPDIFTEVLVVYLSPCNMRY